MRDVSVFNVQLNYKDLYHDVSIFTDAFNYKDPYQDVSVSTVQVNYKEHYRDMSSSTVQLNKPILTEAYRFLKSSIKLRRPWPKLMRAMLTFLSIYAKCFRYEYVLISPLMLALLNWSHWFYLKTLRKIKSQKYPVLPSNLQAFLLLIRNLWYKYL